MRRDIGATGTVSGTIETVSYLEPNTSANETTSRARSAQWHEATITRMIVHTTQTPRDAAAGVGSQAKPKEPSAQVRCADRHFEDPRGGSQLPMR